MAFRGYGDDAMKVAKDKREHMAKMAQIAAQERASRRSADVAMAGIAEGARQFDENIAMRQEEVATRTQQIEADRQARLDEAQTARDFQADEADRRFAFQAEEAERGRMFLSDENERRLAQEYELRDRLIEINEETFAHLNEQWELEKAMQKERTDNKNAALMATLRSISVSGENAHPLFINKINESIGVTRGEPGSITEMFPIGDEETGRIGFGMIEIDKNGNPIQKVINPEEIFPVMFSQMSPESAEKWIGQLVNGNTSAFQDKMTLAAKKYEAELVTRKKEEADRVLKVAGWAAAGKLDLTDTQRESLTKKALEAAGISQKDEGNYRWETEVQDLTTSEKKIPTGVPAGMGPSEERKTVYNEKPDTPVVTEDNTGVYNEKTGAIVLKIGGKSKIIKEVTPEVLDWLKENNIVIRGLPKQ